ncbi:MAG: hypothetical protein QM651_16910 [Rhodoblastus sp.]
MGLQNLILEAIGPDACLLSADIATAVGRPGARVAKTVGQMIQGGYVERIERGCFRLTAKGKAQIGRPIKSGPRGPHTGIRLPDPDTFRQRAWAAMRIMGTFTTADILERAQRLGEKDMADNLGHYLRDLAKVGVVIETPRRSMQGEAPTSNGRKVYRLRRDVGEIAPRVAKAANGGARLVDFNEAREAKRASRNSGGADD